ncbi:hypothetical protein MAM1_0068d04054 [Mucor ambiguus]|uniref:Uncharacterized protein n=1 Tax=Mucor ambiguus TaxID=91626 RepID=A0A0C9MRC1_9FUNG|nr:hypothetical protein MAM1_0068d04054 [Mucor ambiguus]
MNSLGSRFCCGCCSLAVLVMLSLVGNFVLFAAAVAVYLLSWRLLSVRFCCRYRSLAVLMMLYRVSLVLSAAAASIYFWLSW